MARLPVSSKLSGLTSKIVSFSKRRPAPDQLVMPLFSLFMPAKSASNGKWAGFDLTATSTAIAKPVLADAPIVAATIAPSSGYAFLSLRLATFARTNTCEVIVQISTTSGELLLKHSISASQLTDNQFVAFPPTLRPLVEGEEIIITVSSPNSTPENCVAVWGIPSNPTELPIEKSIAPNIDIPLAASFTELPSSIPLIPHIVSTSNTADMPTHQLRGKPDVASIAHQILPGQPLTILLNLGTREFTDISIRFATYGRVNNSHLRWELFDLSLPKLTPFAQGDIHSSLLLDNELWSIPAPAIESSLNSSIALVISSADATLQSCVAVWISAPSDAIPDREKNLPIELSSRDVTLTDFRTFIPFFSTKSSDGIYYSGTSEHLGCAILKQRLISQQQSYSGQFILKERGFSLFGIECSSLDKTMPAEARLTLRSSVGEIVGDMKFSIPTNADRSPFYLHFPPRTVAYDEPFTFTLSCIGPTPFALIGEEFVGDASLAAATQWRHGNPVVVATARSHAGLPEEINAVPLHIPRFSVIVEASDSPVHLVESGFRGDNLAAIPVPLGMVLWSFKAPAGRLQSLEFALATFDRPNFCSVTLDIYRGRHTEAATLPRSCKVVSRLFDARSFTDNEGFIVYIKEEVYSSGEWFTVQVSSPDHSSRDGVAMWCRAFSSHDAVHANLLEPTTEFLNARDYEARRLNLPGLAKVRRETLLSQLPVSLALVVVADPALLPLAKQVQSALTHSTIHSDIIIPGVSNDDVWNLFPRDAIFMVGAIGNHFAELVSICSEMLIPILSLKGFSDSATPDPLAYTYEVSTDSTGKAKLSVYQPFKESRIAVNLSQSIDIADLPQTIVSQRKLDLRALAVTLEEVRDQNAKELLYLRENNDTLVPIEVVVLTDDHAFGCRAQTILETALPGTTVRIANTGIDPLTLSSVSTVFLYGVSPNLEIESTIRHCHEVYVPVALLQDEWFKTEPNQIEPSKSSPLPFVSKINLNNSARLNQIVDYTADLTQQPQPANLIKVINAARKAFAAQRLPLLSIISVLYGKQREVPYFLQALERQSFRGPVELLLVEDCSPDGSLQAVYDYYAEAARSRPDAILPKLKILRNEKNTGNCGSRNRALAEAQGDIILVIDADCLLSRDCLLTHTQSHAMGDSDVVIGHFNLETGDRDPIEALVNFENNPLRVTKEAELQDTINISSFLNTITRNFSITRRFLTEKFNTTPLFDTLFSYSKDPQSGFGWEDVEMGYTLYERGARIKFAPQCFTVHVSHLSNVDEQTKPLRSLKNFRRLLDKHPSITKVARRWVTDTFNKIEKWIENCKAPTTDDLLAVRAKLRGETPEVFCIPHKRPLRILSYRWHCPHQYEIYKLPHNFTLLTGLGPGFTSSWNFEERPLRTNVSMRRYNEATFRESDYDLAILHFDENSVGTYNCNNVLEPDWGAAFQWFVNNLSIPKIAICHGTPQFYGQYNPKYQLSNLGEVIEAERVKMVRYLLSIPVICNSYQAQSEWGFRNSRVIWQGFDPTEFPVTTYSQGIISLGRRVKERPVYRGLPVYEKALKLLPDEHQPSSHLVMQPSPDYQHPSTSWAQAKFRNYVNDLRKYSIYFNPTVRSPMPRSRGEAMMCGLVPVSANNHDVEMFVQNGWNGFYSNSPEELGEFMRECLENPALTKTIGNRARETAVDLFNHDRFLANWQCTLNELVGI